MARVDTVIGYGLYGLTEEGVLNSPAQGFEPDAMMHAQIAAMTKKAAAMAILGASNEEWTGASICTATTLGFPAAPDTFEVSIEVDGSHIFGHNNEDRWTLLPGKDGIPGIFAPSDELTVKVPDFTVINRTAEAWTKDGVTPERVLALGGLVTKLRLDDHTAGYSSLESIRSRPFDSPPTAGIMLKFASDKHSGMWLASPDGEAVLTEIAGVIEEFDPATTHSILTAVEQLPKG